MQKNIKEVSIHKWENQFKVRIHIIRCDSYFKYPKYYQPTYSSLQRITRIINNPCIDKRLSMDIHGLTIIIRF